MTPSLEDLAGQFNTLFAPSMLSPTPPAAPAADGAAPAAPAAPPLPAQAVDFAARGVHLDVKVTPDQVVAAVQVLDRAGFGLDAVTGVDWIKQNEMEVVYDFYHPTATARVAVRARIPRDNPQIPSIHTVFPGANWHERETHDFYGIKFTGHPQLTPFLLPEDADFHPLRKDYAGDPNQGKV